jgi:hypothetical protein
MTEELKYIGSVYANRKTNSRYSNHRVIQVDGVASQETWDPQVIPTSNKDQYYRISSIINWRLDLIADYYYGDQNLWWVIAFANDVVDPFQAFNNPPDPPSVIRIPSVDTVYNKVIK